MGYGVEGFIARHGVGFNHRCYVGVAIYVTIGSTTLGGVAVFDTLSG
jgi:hypothetical protein